MVFVLHNHCINVVYGIQFTILSNLLWTYVIAYSRQIQTLLELYVGRNLSPLPKYRHQNSSKTHAGESNCNCAFRSVLQKPREHKFVRDKFSQWSLYQNTCANWIQNAIYSQRWRIARLEGCPDCLLVLLQWSLEYFVASAYNTTNAHEPGGPCLGRAVTAIRVPRPRPSKIREQYREW